MQPNAPLADLHRPAAYPAPRILVWTIDPSALADDALNRMFLSTADEGEPARVELNVGAPVL